MDKQELIALASAVEKLEGPCRETDQCIHEAVVMGQPQSDRAYPFAKKYTVSLDDAMTLVPDHCWVRMDEWPGGFGQARGTASVHPIRDPAVDGHCAKAETLPLALTAAAIRAIASQEGE